MKKYLVCTLVLVLLLSFSCKKREKENANKTAPQADSTYAEKFRPQFHFSPPKMWMNDPNGLVYNKGIYHLFYQYYPEDTVWGPMHWGHATSTDLTHWDNKPIALYPDKNGYIFSGSAVLDKTNASGLGTEENPPLVAMFTYHNAEMAEAGANNYQTQGIAYSLDNGETWKMYEHNPVIGNEGMIDFRDPKIFWNEESQQWVLILVAGDHAKFYKSDDLKSWTQTGGFGKNIGAHGGVWECPDLFKLKVEGSEEERWVLFISINPGGPNGGNSTQYFIGDFNGGTFTTTQKDIKWLDQGTDNYAGVTYNNTPNGERIFLGWMSNWLYGQKVPTSPWRSAMTLPRDLKLHKVDSDYYVSNYPIENINSITKEENAIDSVSLHGGFDLEKENLNQTDISFTANLSKFLEIEYSNNFNERVVIQLNPDTGVFSIDRRQSGLVDFDETFAKDVQTQSYNPKDEEVEIRLICDTASLEIFVNKGQYVFTNIVFPTNPYTSFSVKSTDGQATIKNFKLNNVNSIWHEE